MSSNNPFNPFANVDMGKFDMTKLFSDVKIPGFDMKAAMDAQRKNIEALNAANLSLIHI